MSHRTIRQIYEGRLLMWAAARVPALRVEVENVTFAPADDEVYLRSFMLPAGTYSDAIGGDHKVYAGLFQVSVVTPAGKGSGEAEGIVEELADLFPLNTQLSKDGLTVMVLSPVEPGPGISSSNTYTVSASFTYRADTN